MTRGALWLAVALCRREFSDVQDLFTAYGADVRAGERQQCDRFALTGDKLDFKGMMVLVAVHHSPDVAALQAMFSDITGQYNSIQFTYHFLISLICSSGIRGDKTRPDILYLNNPDGLYFHGSAVWCCQKTVNDVLFAIRRLNDLCNRFGPSDGQQALLQYSHVRLIEPKRAKELGL